MMLADMARFCTGQDGEGKTGLLCVDTTFELTSDGYWLTDTAYENKALIDKNGKHPFFPGPSMWHFRKDQQEYRHFAATLLEYVPALTEMGEVGHDLDKALANGFQDIYPSSINKWCTQHIQRRDAERLAEIRVGEINKTKIMTDIYGSQTGKFFYST